MPVHQVKPAPLQKNIAPPRDIVASPLSPPAFDPFNVSPEAEPPLTSRQTEAINKKAVKCE